MVVVEHQIVSNFVGLGMGYWESVSNILSNFWALPKYPQKMVTRSMSSPPLPPRMVTRSMFSPPPPPTGWSFQSPQRLWGLFSQDPKSLHIQRLLGTLATQRPSPPLWPNPLHPTPPKSFLPQVALTDHPTEPFPQPPPHLSLEGK